MSSTTTTTPMVTSVHTSGTSAVRFEWFQTPTTITFVFFVKDRQEKHVEVEMEERRVHITLDLEGLPGGGSSTGHSFQYDVSPLFASLDTSVPVKTVVKHIKVEILVTKKISFHWPTLEAPALEAGEETKEIKIPLPPSTSGTGSQEVQAVPVVVPAIKTELTYPNSKKKDWSTFAVEDEADDKPEGEAALQKLFQQIYGNGTDEQRKAMIKSFTESSGTVLSTNWEDVGHRKVTVEPPTGMEAKKMD